MAGILKENKVEANHPDSPPGLFDGRSWNVCLTCKKILSGLMLFVGGSDGAISLIWFSKVEIFSNVCIILSKLGGVFIIKIKLLMIIYGSNCRRTVLIEILHGRSAEKRSQRLLTFLPSKGEEYIYCMIKKQRFKEIFNYLLCYLWRSRITFSVWKEKRGRKNVSKNFKEFLLYFICNEKAARSKLKLPNNTGWSLGFQPILLFLFKS